MGLKSGSRIGEKKRLVKMIESLWVFGYLVAGVLLVRGYLMSQREAKRRTKEHVRIAKGGVIFTL